MAKVFEQFKAGEKEEQPEASTHTSEEHLYIITKPAKEKEIKVEHSIQDCVEEEGYTKRIKAVVLETGCCGMLTSFSPDTRYKPPAGRCQNPDCRVLLCQKHVEETFTCCICGKPLCPACMRVSRKKGLFFCKEHFQKLAEKENHKEITECLTEKQISRRK